MTAERALALVLRFHGAVVLPALAGALMPTDTMAAYYRDLGLGEMPRVPLVEYLARSLSLMYAGAAPMMFVLSLDVRRYRPPIQVVNYFGLAFGAAMFTLDLWVGMPLYWVLWEGPSIIALSAVQLVLTWRVPDWSPEAPRHAKERAL
jgi:hypothetical protein